MLRIDPEPLPPPRGMLRLDPELQQLGLARQLLVHNSEHISRLSQQTGSIKPSTGLDWELTNLGQMSRSGCMLRKSGLFRPREPGMLRLGGDSEHISGGLGRGRGGWRLRSPGGRGMIRGATAARAKETEMTLQLSIDDHIVQGARKVAESMGTSIDQLVRDYLEQLTSQQSLDDEMEELRRLSGQGDSRGWKFNRDEIHERR